jgi:hypothetical protein
MAPRKFQRKKGGKKPVKKDTPDPKRPKTVPKFMFFGKSALAAYPDAEGNPMYMGDAEDQEEFFRKGQIFGGRNKTNCERDAQDRIRTPCLSHLPRSLAPCSPRLGWAMVRLSERQHDEQASRRHDGPADGYRQHDDVASRLRDGRRVQMPGCAHAAHVRAHSRVDVLQFRRCLVFQTGMTS